MKGAKGLPKPKPKPMQLEVERRLGGKLNNQGYHLQEEDRKLNSGFGDVPCFVVKITHIQNKGRHIGAHLGPQGMMKK